VRKALSWPARQIAINAGEDGSIIVGGDTAASSPRTNPAGCSHRLNIQSDQAVTSFFRCPGPMTLRSTFLDSEDVMRGQFGTAGFRILEWKNYSSRVIEHYDRMLEAPPNKPCRSSLETTCPNGSATHGAI
jgi:hypothetical protein